MAGYTRQSIADIINGAEITAPPLNAEFNQLSAAFNATTGHSHDGTAGNSPKINLTTSVAGYLPAAHGGVGGQNNTTATTNPLVTDDSTQGYAPGSIWENTTTGRIFICVGNASGAAVWRELVQVQTSNVIFPEVNDTVDLGSVTNRFQDLFLSGGIAASGNMSFGGTLNVNGSTALSSTLAVTGLSTLATVDINGGNIDGTIIGAATRAAGNFTTASTTGLATLASADINGGTIDGAVIGGVSPTTVTGTNITATTGFSGPLTGSVTGNVTGNLTGNVTGNVAGNVTGDVTSTGTSTFQNVTINGSLNMNAGTAATVTGLSAPVNGTDATTKTYVDAADATKLNLSGGTMSGAIAMGANKITGLGTPVNAADAATKGYVDTSVSNLIDAAPGALDTLNELASALGDDPNFSTTITNSIATKLPLAGGTMTGDITLGANKATSTATPTANDDLTRKGYVDTQVGTRLPLAGGTMTGAIAMGNSKITGLGTPTAGTDATTKTYVDGVDATKLNLSGGTMTGGIVMGANKVTSTATPTVADDLTRKGYVDGILGSATAAADSAAAASTSETNAANSASAALTSEQNADTSETNAANSAAAALTSEQNAASSAASINPNSIDINGGTIDGTVIGGSTPAAISGTTGQFGTSLNVDGTVTADGLTVDGSVNIDAAVPILRLDSPDTAWAGGEDLGGIDWYTKDPSGAAPAVMARIYSESVGANTLPIPEIIFQTTLADTVLKDRMKIGVGGDISFYEDTGTTPKFFWDASAERLGLGTVSPAFQLQITNASDAILALTAGTGAAQYAQILFGDSAGAAQGRIRYQNSDDSLGFVVNGGPKMLITSAGNVGIGTSSPVSFGSQTSVTVQGTSIGRVDVLGAAGKGGAITGTATAFNIGGTFNVPLGLTASSTAPITLTTNGTERLRITSTGTLIHKLAAVFNEDGADADFRVESDANTHALFVDAGSDHVNIGMSGDFGQRLNVNGGIGLAANPTVTWDSNSLKLQTRSASVPVIQFLASGSGNFAPRLDIMNGSGTVQHRIDAAGPTTFNETGVNVDFRVESDANASMLLVDAGSDQVLVGGSTPLLNANLGIRGAYVQATASGATFDLQLSPRSMYFFTARNNVSSDAFVGAVVCTGLGSLTPTIFDITGRGLSNAFISASTLTSGGNPFLRLTNEHAAAQSISVNLAAMSNQL